MKSLQYRCVAVLLRQREQPMTTADILIDSRNLWTSMKDRSASFSNSCFFKLAKLEWMFESKNEC